MIILFVLQLEVVDGFHNLSTGFGKAPLGSSIVVELAVGIRSARKVAWWWQHIACYGWWWQISGHHFISGHQSGTDR